MNRSIPKWRVNFVFFSANIMHCIRCQIRLNLLHFIFTVSKCKKIGTNNGILLLNLLQNLNKGIFDQLTYHCTWMKIWLGIRMQKVGNITITKHLELHFKDQRYKRSYIYEDEKSWIRLVRNIQMKKIFEMGLTW